MVTTPPQRKRRLGEILVAANVIDEMQLKAALSEQRKWGGKLGRIVVEMGFCREDAMVQALSQQLGLPTVDLDALQVAPEVVQALRIDLAERYGVFPLAMDRRTKVLQLATGDPTNLEALQELHVATGYRIQPVITSNSAVDRAIRHWYYGEAVTASNVASPEAFGVQESTFELESSGPRTTPASHPTEPAMSLELTAMREQVARLDQIVAGQTRALRGILELLIEKGFVTRDEYLARVRPK